MQLAILRESMGLDKGLKNAALRSAKSHSAYARRAFSIVRIVKLFITDDIRGPDPTPHKLTPLRADEKSLKNDVEAENHASDWQNNNQNNPRRAFSLVRIVKVLITDNVQGSCPAPPTRIPLRAAS